MPPPRRGHYAALSSAFAALSVYGSLVPLEFKAVPWDEAQARFMRIPWQELGIESRSDWVANILLFVPLAYLITAALQVDRPGRFRAFVSTTVVLVTCSLLSISVEFSQIWFPPRTVSQNDIAAEVLGSIIGVGLWCLVGRRLTAFARAYASASTHPRQLDLLLRAYLTGLLIYALLPLDLTISPADLWRKYRDGKILAFAVAGDGPLEWIASALSKILPFLPVGLLASSLLRPHRSRLDDMGRGLAMGVLLAAAIEAAQLLVYSRYTNGADVLCGALGVGIGAGRWWGRWPDSADSVVPARPGRTWVWLGLSAAYAAALAILFWMPFRFTGDRDLVLARLHGLARTPFSALYWGTDWNAMTQITSKVLWFAPLGGLLARGILPGATTTLGRRFRAGASLLFCLAVATAIELGQVLLPDRTADFTDVLIYQAGASVGLFLMARAITLPDTKLHATNSMPGG